LYNVSSENYSYRIVNRCSGADKVKIENKKGTKGLYLFLANGIRQTIMDNKKLQELALRNEQKVTHTQEEQEMVMKSEQAWG
jgi:hypothetical protein